MTWKCRIFLFLVFVLFCFSQIWMCWITLAKGSTLCCPTYSSSYLRGHIEYNVCEEVQISEQTITKVWTLLSSIHCLISGADFYLFPTCAGCFADPSFLCMLHTGSGYAWVMRMTFRKLVVSQVLFQSQINHSSSFPQPFPMCMTTWWVIADTEYPEWFPVSMQCWVS